MKQIVILSLLSLAFWSCDKETILVENEIPKEITSFVDTYFPENLIIQAINETDDLKRTYEVMLEGQISLEFNRKKELISAKSPNQLPNGVVPSKLVSYASIHYQTQFIVEWNLDDRDQEIELNNGIELKFNKKGEFTKIDNSL